jgi:hypothetical protein
MATIISADQLDVGDVYRSLGSMRVLEADAYQVVNIRTVRSTETYQVIEATNLRTGLAASINLRHDVEVAQLETQPLADLKGYLDYMPEGEALHIYRHDGKFWT